MKMKKKGSIELSMTTIIVIVLGVTLLTLGIVWVKSLGSSLLDTSEGAFKVSQEEISKLGLRDQEVYVPGTDMSVKIGGTLRFDVFVQNFLGTDEEFTLKFEGDGSEWLETATKINIKAGDWAKFPVVVRAPKTVAAGEIKIITLNVLKKDGESYGQDAITLEVTK